MNQIISLSLVPIGEDENPELPTPKRWCLARWKQDRQVTQIMRLFVSSDAHWESRLGQVLDELTDFKFRQHFEQQDYGPGLAGVSVIFMCRDPALAFKRRVKLSKKEKNLHMDIMLDLPTMKAALPEERKRIVAQRLFNEVPEVLAGYKIPNFNKDGFVADLRAWIDGIGWR